MATDFAEGEMTPEDMRRMLQACSTQIAAMEADRSVQYARIEQLELTVKHLREDRAGLMATVRAMSGEMDLLTGRAVKLVR